MEKLEEQAGISEEFSDFILKNIENANSNKRYIMAEELLQYTKDFFALNFSGSRIENNDDKSLFITLSLEAQLNFRNYLKNNRYRVSYLGFRTEPLLCIFNNNRDGYRKYRVYELIDLNHAFMKWMKQISQDKKLNNYPCSAIKVKVNCVDIRKGFYVYYIRKWETKGYRNTSELKYYVIDVETREIIDEKKTENFVICSLTYGCDFLEIKYGLNDYDSIIFAMDKCKEYAENKFIQYEAGFNGENELVCERSREYLSRTYERKIASIEEQIRKAKEAGQAERILRMHEGKKRKTEETFTSQLSKMDDKKKGVFRDSDIAVGLIKVED